MRRASIVISAHNEGERLWKTVRSCLATTSDLGCEVLVADDASSDGSVREMRRRFPKVRVVRQRKRAGTSPTKDLGGRKARGRILVFLDGHCKPEPWAIERIVRSVEELEGRAIVTPRIPALDCERWENSENQFGHGYRIDLEKFDCRWVSLEEMSTVGRYYESPAFIGCCAAMSAELYRKVRGFDRYMIEWGVEDIDFGLKAWLMGYSILHNPDASIGHRFRESFDNFSVDSVAVPVNQLRMARKNFTEAIWKVWLERFLERQPEELRDAVWEKFCEGRESVEAERAYLLQHRVRDELAYAERFGLDWPVPRRTAGQPTSTERETVPETAPAEGREEGP